MILGRWWLRWSWKKWPVLSSHRGQLPCHVLFMGRGYADLPSVCFSVCLLNLVLGLRSATVKTSQPASETAVQQGETVIKPVGRVQGGERWSRAAKPLSVRSMALLHSRFLCTPWREEVSNECAVFTGFTSHGSPCFSLKADYLLWEWR